MKKLLSIFLLWNLLCVSYAQTPNEEKNESRENLVLLSVDLLSHQNKHYLALSYRNAPGWHTYWKNPGEAGLATSFKFEIDSSPIEFKELEWPTPKRYVEEGEIITFGYSNDYTMFFEVTANQLKQMDNKTLQVYSNWLVCKDICIPGEVTQLYRVDGNSLIAESTRPFELIQDILAARFDLLPRTEEIPTYVDMVLAKDPEKEGLILYTNLTMPQEQAPQEKMNILTPFQLKPLDFRQEEVFKDKNHNLYARMKIDWDGVYQSPPQDFPADGKFSTPLTFRFLFADPVTKKVSIVEKTFHEFSLNAAEGIEKFTSMLTQIYPEKKELSSEAVVAESLAAPLDLASSQKGFASQGLLGFLLFALLGGFILNLMPCVLPVISLKLFGLIQHSGESRSRILKHNLFYTLGVLSTFWAIAAIVITLKSAGEGVGWGFQLQSPNFVALMAVVIFILSLNMFGLYEFATPGGRQLGGVKIQDGYLGDFFSGVLATILSTPCSAPFLGTALTFAFTSSNATIFAVLTFVGLGLSLPFLLTGFFPVLVKFLPRPGLWMDNFKKVLALTLVITSLWLLDVYSALVTDLKSTFRLQVIMLLCFFVIFMWNKMTKKIAYHLPLVGITLALFVGLLTRHQALPASSSVSPQVRQHLEKGGQSWEPWSQERLAELAQSKDLVFINFSAQWCLTCKVHERLVLRTDRFSELVKNYNVKLLLGDWTRRDKNIGDWLTQRGLVGVPAYFVQLPSGEMISLGETITNDKIEEAFKKAQR